MPDKSRHALYNAITESAPHVDIVLANRLLADLDAALREPFFPAFHHAITAFVRRTLTHLGPAAHLGDQLLAYLAINQEADIIASLDECTLGRTICYLHYLTNSWVIVPYIVLCLRHHNDGPARRILPRLGLLSYDTLYTILEEVNEQNAATVVAAMDVSNTDGIIGYASQKRTMQHTRVILEAIANMGTPLPTTAKAKIVYSIPSSVSVSSISQ